MSLTFIHNFQNRIYNTLLASDVLKVAIDKIYIGPVQDAKTPFLVINITHAEDNSLHKEALYSVDFQISAYAKDRNFQLLTSVSDACVSSLENINKAFSGYIISGLRANKIDFCKAKDMVRNQLIINYKAFIRKKVSR